MRVLFVTREYPPDSAIGGIGYNISGLVPGLVARGHDVHVLTCFPGVASEDVDDRGATVHRRPTVSIPLLHRVFRGPNLAPRIESAISVGLAYRSLRLRPDVVNIPDWFGEGLLLALCTRVPLVLYLHTPLFLILRHNGMAPGRQALLADHMERATARRATIVTSTSQQLFDDLDGWLAAGADAIITPPPVRVDTLDDVDPVSDTDPVLLAVGRIEARKAPELLIEAAALLREEGLDVTVALVGTSSGTVGGVEYVDWVRGFAAEHDVPIELPGQLDRQELRTWFGRARVVAVPSVYESFSLAALEAGAAGRPVVVTEGVGAKEVVAGTGGAVVPVGDAAALAEACRPWLVDAAKAQADGAALRERVLGQCHPDIASARREAAFEEAVRVPRPTHWRRVLGGHRSRGRR